MQMLMTSLHEVIRFVSILELSDEKTVGKTAEVTQNFWRAAISTILE